MYVSPVSKTESFFHRKACQKCKYILCVFCIDLIHSRFCRRAGMPVGRNFASGETNMGGKILYRKRLGQMRCSKKRPVINVRIYERSGKSSDLENPKQPLLCCHRSCICFADNIGNGAKGAECYKTIFGFYLSEHIFWYAVIWAWKKRENRDGWNRASAEKRKGPVFQNRTFQAWCPGRDSNSHGPNCPPPPQSGVSTNSTTWAFIASAKIGIFAANSKFFAVKKYQLLLCTV